MKSIQCILLTILLFYVFECKYTLAFTIINNNNNNKFSPTCKSINQNVQNNLYNVIHTKLFVSDDNLKGVIELSDDETNQQQTTSTTTKEISTTTSVSAPFLSQGEIDPQALNPDFNDPKQARVIIYILLSLIPVLFLIPLMLSSRELIPLDSLPPVTL